MENPTIFQKVRANRLQCFLIHSLNTDITFRKRISTLHPIDQSTPSLTAPPLDKTCIDCASVISLLFDKNEIWGNKLLLLFGCRRLSHWWLFLVMFPRPPRGTPLKGKGEGFPLASLAAAGNARLLHAWCCLWWLDVWAFKAGPHVGRFQRNIAISYFCASIFCPLDRTVGGECSWAGWTAHSEQQLRGALFVN